MISALSARLTFNLPCAKETPASPPDPVMLLEGFVAGESAGSVGAWESSSLVPLGACGSKQKQHFYTFLSPKETPNPIQEVKEKTVFNNVLKWDDKREATNCII